MSPSLQLCSSEQLTQQLMLADVKARRIFRHEYVENGERSDKFVDRRITARSKCTILTNGRIRQSITVHHLVEMNMMAIKLFVASSDERLMHSVLVAAFAMQSHV